MRKLYLSSTDQKLSGVCGGLGEYFDIDPTVIRLLWVFGTLLTGIVPGVFAYILAVVLMPREADLMVKKK